MKAEELLSKPKVTVYKKGHFTRHQNFWGWLLITPAVFGLTIWVAFPLLLSLFASFWEWDMLMPPKFIGFNNYIYMFTIDPLFYRAVWVTIYFTLVGIPLQMITAFIAALLLNTKVKCMGVFRTLYYMPTLLPVAVSSALWLWLFNRQFGLFNLILENLGLPIQDWVFSPTTVIPSLILMSIWGIGNVIVIFLAGLQGIPQELMEAVAIDGGHAGHRFVHVTLPLTSPVIFYNVIIGIIGGLQTFTQPYLMTNGGPANGSMFFVLHLYKQAFQYSKMGYACALAWMLFIFTSIIAGLLFRSASLWVFYEGEGRK